MSGSQSELKCARSAQFQRVSENLAKKQEVKRIENSEPLLNKNGRKPQGKNCRSPPTVLAFSDPIFDENAQITNVLLHKEFTFQKIWQKNRRSKGLKILSLYKIKTAENHKARTVGPRLQFKARTVGPRLQFW